MTVVLAAQAWPTNGHLIYDVARLGHLRRTDRILDVTFGLGRFWRLWWPTDGALLGVDLDPTKSQTGEPVDFTALPYPDRSWDVVVLDPPYKLNGTSREQDRAADEQYGVHVPGSWQDRHDLIYRGIDECTRVAARTLLVKCQAQVCGGRIRWQDRLFADRAEAHGFELVDRFDLLGKHRKQPMDGRVQRTAHGRPSTLLVLESAKRRRPKP